jgi:hypothetical protein
MSHRECKDCHEKLPLEQSFYKTGQGFNWRCKRCHNARRKLYRVTPAARRRKVPSNRWFVLSDETKYEIATMIKAKAKLKEIAPRYNIPYSTLCYWSRKGHFKPFEPK